MKNKSVLQILLPILAWIPVFVGIHFIGVSDSEDTRMLIGALASTAFFALFAILLFVQHRKYVQEHDRLQRILDTTDEAIYGVDDQGRCNFANQACLTLLGYESEADLLGKVMHNLVYHTQSDDVRDLEKQCALMQAIKNGDTLSVRQDYFYRKDGSSFSVAYQVNPFHATQGSMTGAVVMFRETTAQRLAEERVNYLLYHDPITGFYNQTFVHAEIDRLDVARNIPFSVVFGDVNGLKLTNDIFGHKAGNKLLETIANAIRLSCRADDMIARIGGDEFIILLPQTTSEAAANMIDRIQEEVAGKTVNSLNGSIALGAATKTDVADDLEEIINDAEEAMYKNKTLKQQETRMDQLRQLIESLHTRSRREKIHSDNVSTLCERISTQLDLSSEKIRRAKTAGYYHDVGKVVLPDDVLCESDTLDEEDQIEMKRHSIVGFRILNRFDETMDIARSVLDHHEHWDGTGYPKGIKQDEIHLLARIIAVAEAYDFRTNPVRGSQMGAREAIEEIEALAGIHYDPSVVAAAKQVIEKEDRSV